MSTRQYIMVTGFEKHWDQVNGRSAYLKTMYKGSGLPRANIETIFIRRNKTTNKIEGCWSGKILDVKEDGKQYRFTFRLDPREIECPAEHVKYSINGWYCDEAPTGHHRDERELFEPPFFKTLCTTDDWREFEKLVFCLLKLLGLQKIYRFPDYNQAGKSDGVFQTEKMFVIYDATLQADLKKKETQIENYVAQLQNDKKVKVGERHLLVVDKAATKQVWIITRGTKTKLLEKNGGVEIKEVTANDLIDLYHARLEEEFDDTKFEKRIETL